MQHTSVVDLTDGVNISGRLVDLTDPAVQGMAPRLMCRVMSKAR
jgi:hypothetical protein